MLERAANSRRYVDDWFAGQGVRLAPEIELGAHELLPSFAAIGVGPVSYTHLDVYKRQPFNERTQYDLCDHS